MGLDKLKNTIEPNISYKVVGLIVPPLIYFANAFGHFHGPMAIEAGLALPSQTDPVHNYDVKDPVNFRAGTVMFRTHLQTLTSRAF